MGLKVTKLRKKVFNVNKSANLSFDSYENIKCYARKGDLMEVIYGLKSHFVFVAKVDSNNVWCFHVQQLPKYRHKSNGFAVIKYEPLTEVLKDIFPNEIPFYRINNQIELSNKVLELTQNSIPNLNEVIVILNSFRNTIVRYGENSCNSEHYVTLWKYGMGWSNANNSVKRIIKTIKMFRKSFAKSGYENDIEITNEIVVNNDVCLIMFCFGLYGEKLLDGIYYVMERQRVLQI